MAARLPPGVPPAPHPTAQSPRFRTLSPASALPVPLPLTWDGALSKAVAAILAENALVHFKEVLCFIKDVLDLLQRPEG